MNDAFAFSGTWLERIESTGWVWVGTVLAMTLATSPSSGQQITTSHSEGERTGAVPRVHRDWEARHISPNAEASGYFGAAIDVAGDRTGDEIPDLLVGAPRESPNGREKSGQVYLLNGIGGLPIRRISSPNAQPNGRFGASVTSIRDVSGDGQNEWLIGAPGEDVAGVEGAGKMYVVDGGSGAVLQEIRSPRPVEHGRFGESGTVLKTPSGEGGDRAAYGDVEIAIGAPGEKVQVRRESSTDTLMGAGRVYTFALEREIDEQKEINAVTKAILDSPKPETNGHFGKALDVGDVGPETVHSGLIVGADESPRGTRHAGRVYLTGSNGEAVRGAVRSPDPTRNGRFGASVTSVPDVDGDKSQELLVGAPIETPAGGQGLKGGGTVYLIDGGSGQALKQFTLPRADRNSFFGMAIDAAYDSDGDEANQRPHLELLVGSARESQQKRGAGVIYRFDL